MMYLLKNKTPIKNHDESLGYVKNKTLINNDNESIGYVKNKNPHKQ